MAQNLGGAFREALDISCAQERVQQDVIGFERRVGLQFATPVAFFVLLGKEELAGGVDRDGNAAGEVINFAEAHLRGRAQGGGGGVVFHSGFTPRWRSPQTRGASSVSTG